MIDWISLTMSITGTLDSGLKLNASPHIAVLVSHFAEPEVGVDHVLHVDVVAR